MGNGYFLTVEEKRKKCEKSCGKVKLYSYSILVTLVISPQQKQDIFVPFPKSCGSQKKMESELEGIKRQKS